jgi:AcrR family transcriptional regulator
MSATTAIVDPGSARQRLLDAAERLFAEHGFHGVSLRTITTEAGMNLAAANYYFGGKEGLFRAVFARRVGPMNAERAQRLDACLERAGADPPDVGEVLEAFIGPAVVVSASSGAEMFKKLSGRASTDPSPEVRAVVYELYDDIAKRFIDTIRRACPRLSRAELFWRLACVYGAMMYVRADSRRLQRLLGEDLDMTDSETAMRHLIPFLVAGMNSESIDHKGE